MRGCLRNAVGGPRLKSVGNNCIRLTVETGYFNNRVFKTNFRSKNVLKISGFYYISISGSQPGVNGPLRGPQDFKMYNTVHGRGFTECFEGCTAGELYKLTNLFRSKMCEDI